MRIIPIFVAIMALPLMTLGQTTDQQQGASQDQKDQNQEQTPPKKKKARPGHEAGRPEARPETGTNMRGETKTEGRAPDVKNSETRSSSKTQTKVNKQEFRSRHQEVFSLGRHPKEFFIQRYGASHFRLIGNTYFVFVDGCWVAVDVAGFTFVERVICEGDPDFIVVY